MSALSADSKDKVLLKLNRDFLPSVALAESHAKRSTPKDKNNTSPNDDNNLLLSSHKISSSSIINKKPTEMQQVRTEIEAILFPSFPFTPNSDPRLKLNYINKIAVAAKEKERNQVLEKDSKRRQKHVARNLLAALPNPKLPKIAVIDPGEQQEEEILNAQYSNPISPSVFIKAPAVLPTELVLASRSKLTKNIRYVRKPLKLPPIRINNSDPLDLEEHREYFDWIAHNFFEDYIPVTATAANDPSKKSSPLDEIYKFEILLLGEAEAARNLRLKQKQNQEELLDHKSTENGDKKTVSKKNSQKRGSISNEYQEMDKVAHSKIPKLRPTAATLKQEKVNRRLRQLRLESVKRQRSKAIKLQKHPIGFPKSESRFPRYVYERLWRVKKLPKPRHFDSINHILEKNPSLPHPIIRAVQAEEGLYNLMERGFIPKNADFTPGLIDLTKFFRSEKAELHMNPYSTVFYRDLQRNNDDALMKFRKSVKDRASFMKQLNSIKTFGSMKKSTSMNLNFSTMNLNSLMESDSSRETTVEADDGLDVNNDTVIRNLLLPSLSTNDLSAPLGDKKRRGSRLMNVMRDKEKLEVNNYERNKLAEQLRQLEDLRINNPFVKFESVVNVIQRQRNKNASQNRAASGGKRKGSVSGGSFAVPNLSDLDSDKVFQVQVNLNDFDYNAPTPAHSPDEADSDDESERTINVIKGLPGDHQNRKFITSGGAFILNTMVDSDAGIESLALSKRMSQVHGSTSTLRKSSYATFKRDHSSNTLEIPDKPVFPYGTLLNVQQNTTNQDNSEMREFLIANGKLIESLPPYIAFREKNRARWGTYLVLLKDMEELFTKYAVSMAQIDGKKLEVAANRYYMDKVKTDILTSCLINQVSVEKTMNQTGQRYKGKDGQLSAIKKIQATFRMYSWRKWYLWQLTRRAAAATFIHFYTANRLKQQVRVKMAAKREQMLIDSPILQAKFKENWDIIRSRQSNKVIIHFPANALWIHWRERNPRNARLPLAQMSRILDLIDTNARIIMVTPKEPEPHFLEFYINILESHKAAKNLEERLIWMHPDSYHCYPDHAPAVSSLVTSTDTWKDLKENFGDSSGYMVPGVMSSYDMIISTRLNVPFLAATPELVQKLLLKTGAREIFKEANVYHPPGTYIENPTVEAIAEQIISLSFDFPQYPRWVLKINQDSVQGYAYIDISMLPKENSENDPDPIENEDSHNDLIAVRDKPRMIREFSATLLEHLRLVYPMYYTTNEEYFYYANKFGIIIEGVPSLLRGNSPQCFCLIHPTGNIEVLGAVDQIYIDNFISCGFSAPQRNCPYDLLKEATDKICNVLYEKGYFGHLTIDFIMTDRSDIQNPDQKIPKLMATGISPYYSNRLGNYISLVQMCHGSWTDAGTLISYFDPASRRDVWFISRLENDDIKKTGMVKQSSFEPKEFKGIYLEDVQHSHLSLIDFPVFRNLCRSLGMNIDDKKLYGVEMRPTYDKKKIDLMFLKHSRGDCFDTAAITLLAINLLLTNDSLAGETNMMDIYVGLLFAYREGKEAAKAGKKSTKLEKSYKEAGGESSPTGSKSALDVKSGNKKKSTVGGNKTIISSKLKISGDTSSNDKAEKEERPLSSLKAKPGDSPKNPSVRFTEGTLGLKSGLKVNSSGGRSTPDSSKSPLSQTAYAISIENGDDSIVKEDPTAVTTVTIAIDGSVDGQANIPRFPSLEITDYLMPAIDMKRLTEFRALLGNQSSQVVQTGSQSVDGIAPSEPTKLGNMNTEMASLFFIEDIFRQTSYNLFGYRGREDASRPLLQSKSMRNLIQSLWKIAEPIISPSSSKGLSGRQTTFDAMKADSLSARRSSFLRSSFMGSSFLGSRNLSEGVSTDAIGPQSLTNATESKGSMGSNGENRLYKDLKSWIQKDDSKEGSSDHDQNIRVSLGDLKDFKLSGSKTVTDGMNRNESSMAAETGELGLENDDDDELYEGLSPAEILNAIQNFANNSPAIPHSPAINNIPRSDGKVINAPSRRGSVSTSNANKKRGSISALAKKRGQAVIPNSPNPGNSTNNGPGTPLRKKSSSAALTRMDSLSVKVTSDSTTGGAGDLHAEDGATDSNNEGETPETPTEENMAIQKDRETPNPSRRMSHSKRSQSHSQSRDVRKSSVAMPSPNPALASKSITHSEAPKKSQQGNPPEQSNILNGVNIFENDDVIKFINEDPNKSP